MVHKVSKDFAKGFNNHVKYGRPINDQSESFSESEYKTIIESIEKIFGYKIIQMDYWWRSILTGSDELRIYDKYGERITTKYGDNWGKYKLDGILTFDEYYKRFVIFQFRDHFAYSDSAFHIIDGISQFRHYESLDINYGIEYLNENNKANINTKLNKLIIFYRNTHHSQLIQFFDTSKKYNKTIELWKYTQVDENISTVEHSFPEYKGIKWVNAEINEKQFWEYYGFSDIVMRNYEIFKEYVKFTFSDIEIVCGVDEYKFDYFIKELDGNYNEYVAGYFDTYFGKVAPRSSMDIPTDEIKYLNQFIISYTDNIKKYHAADIKIDFRDFLFFKVKVKTKGTRIDKESKLHYLESSKDDILFFNLNLENKNIIISITLNNQKVKKGLDNLIIDEKTTMSDIDHFVNSFYENEIIE